MKEICAGVTVAFKLLPCNALYDCGGVCRLTACLNKLGKVVICLSQYVV